MSANPFVPSRVSGNERGRELMDMLHVVHAQKPLHERMQERTARNATVWSYMVNWADACSSTDGSYARLTRDALNRHVMQHSLQRGLSAFFVDQKSHVEQLQAQVEVQRLVLRTLLTSFESSAPAVGGLTDLLANLQSQLEAVPHVVTRAVPLTLEGFISSRDLSSSISMIERFATELFGEESRVVASLEKSHDSVDYELVLEVRYPDTTERAAARQFMERYSTEVPEAHQQVITILRLPH